MEGGFLYRRIRCIQQYQVFGQICFPPSAKQLSFPYNLLPLPTSRKGEMLSNQSTVTTCIRAGATREQQFAALSLKQG